MKFNFTFGLKQRAGVVVAIACLIGISLLSGCSKRQSVRWGPAGFNYSGDQIDIYWKREVILAKSFGWEASNTKIKVLSTSYLRTRLDLDSMQSIDEAISEETFQNFFQTKTNCLSSYESNAVVALSRPVDVNCEENWAVIGANDSGKALLMLVNPENQVTILPNIDPFSFIRGAVNEKGDYVLFGINAVFQRITGNGVGEAFVVFKDGQWWEVKLPGEFPQELKSDYKVISSIPSLVSIPKERIAIKKPEDVHIVE